MKKASLISAVIFTGLFSLSFSGKKDPSSQHFSSSDTYTKAAITGFEFFRVHRQARNAALAWGVTSETGVIGFIVERSYDGVFFNPVGQYPVEGRRSYQWKDLAVFPGLIYYRVGCLMADGTTVYSPVETVRIVVH